MTSKRISFRKKLALEITKITRADVARQHPLQTLFWECTLRCNAACRHCGSDCKVSPESKDMPVADFLRVIDTITPHVNPNQVLVIFTGGEALVRNDIEQCGIELYRRGYPWGIVSNGYVLTEKRLLSLRKAGLHAMTISLDGFAEAHDWLRRVPNGFQKATQAIQLLTKTTDIVWDVVTCANQQNIDSLAEFKDYLLSLGVKQWRIFTIFPVGRAAENPELQLSDEQFTQLMNFIADTRKEGRIHVSYGCEGFLGGYEAEVRDTFYHCDAGITVGSILHDGSISACPSIRADYSQGNIYHDDFLTVWENKFEKFRNRSWMKKGICSDCKMYRYCEGNGFHLRDGNGHLLVCHYNRLVK
ncbi:MAG: TIGR04133 family radical SAM/SPASM protein [Bacteroidales bacterium]|nr:TIGR04133 family radical SAM/SPASM protein [Bacteroidales bacterium]